MLCFGLVMADVLVSGLKRLPRNWEEMVVGESSVIAVGGGAANSARTFAKLGEPVDLLGRVGGDYFGTFVKNDTEACKVNCSALLLDREHTTGVALGLVHKDGNRCFVTVQGANAAMDKTDFERIDFDHYDFMHINGFFQFPGIEPDLKGIIEEVHKRGGRVSLDTASSDPFGRWFTAVEPFIHCVDYLFLNKSQLLLMAGKETVDQGAEAMLEAGVKHVIVKLGQEGCLIYGPEAPVHVPAMRIEAVDTTGAGDSFDAAYIAGLRRGWSQEQCARLANTVAGMNCCHLGSTAGVPDWNIAMERMKLFYGAED